MIGTGFLERNEISRLIDHSWNEDGKSAWFSLLEVNNFNTNVWPLSIPFPLEEILGFMDLKVELVLIKENQFSVSCLPTI